MATINSKIKTNKFESVLRNANLTFNEKLAFYIQIAKESKLANNTSDEIECLYKVANLHFINGYFFIAIRKTLLVFDLINQQTKPDKKQLAYVYNLMGSIYNDGFQKYKLALDFFFKALQVNARVINEYIYNNIGIVYGSVKNHKKAIQYYNLALNEINKTQTSNQIHLTFISQIYHNIAEEYLDLNELESAKKYYQKSFKVSESFEKKLDYITSFPLSYCGLARIYILQKKDRKEILQLFDKGLKIAKKYNQKPQFQKVLLAKMHYYKSIKEDEAFLNCAEKILKISSNDLLLSVAKNCASVLQDYYAQKQDYKNAFINAKRLIDINLQFNEKKELNSIANVVEQQENEILNLEFKNKRIEQQNRELEKFTFIVAHDLKEPLRNIGSYASILNKRYKDLLKEEGKEYLQYVTFNSIHMYNMLDDLSTYISLKLDEKSIQKINPNEIISNYINSIQKLIKENKVRFLIESLDEIEIEPYHFQLLISNLILNAIKFKQIEKKLVLKIYSKKLDNHTEITISDNGIGINDE